MYYVEVPKGKKITPKTKVYKRNNLDYLEVGQRQVKPGSKVALFYRFDFQEQPIIHGLTKWNN